MANYTFLWLPSNNRHLRNRKQSRNLLQHESCNSGPWSAGYLFSILNQIRSKNGHDFFDKSPNYAISRVWSLFARHLCTEKFINAPRIFRKCDAGKERVAVFSEQIIPPCDRSFNFPMFFKIALFLRIIKSISCHLKRTQHFWDQEKYKWILSGFV